MTKAELIEAAQLANTVYLGSTDSTQKALSPLGHTLLTRVSDDDYQVIITRKQGLNYVVFAGSRPMIEYPEDWIDDSDFIPNDDTLPGAFPGFCNGLVKMWQTKLLLHIYPAFPYCRIIGHSLGGARALLTPLFFSPDFIHSIVTFGAPKVLSINAIKEYPSHKAFQIIHDRDTLASWPPGDDYRHPDPVYLLTQGSLKATSELPDATEPEDHLIASYIATLESLPKDCAI